MTILFFQKETSKFSQDISTTSVDIQYLMQEKGILMLELIFTCPEAGYELYSDLKRYFKVEIIDSNNGEMGVLDALKVLVEPISKTVETLGNIIIALINRNACTISVKNGEKEASFNGTIKQLRKQDVMEMLCKVIEG